MSKVKKLLAMLMAVVMTLGMSVTAFAAPNETQPITVSGLASTGTNQVQYYKILEPNTTAPSGYSIVAGVTIPGFANAKTFLNAGIQNQKAELKAEGANLGSAMSGGNLDPTGTTFTATVEAGYYAVVITNTPEEGDPQIIYDNPIIVSVEYDKATLQSDGSYHYNALPNGVQSSIVAKYETIPVDKESEDTDDIGEIGSTQTYTIETYIPSNTEKLILKDTLTGATYKQDTVKINIDGYGQIDTTGLVAFDEAQNTMTITLTNYLYDENDEGEKVSNAGKHVLVSYDVTVTGTLVHNDVSYDGDHHYGTDTTNLRTGAIKLTKTGDDGDDEDELPDLLPNARFVVRRDSDDKYLVKTDNTGTSTFVYTWTGDKNAATKFATNDQGVILIEGLDKGIYFFEEVEAPNGYSVNTEAKRVEIKDENLTSWDKENKVTIPATPAATDMHDTKLASLPSTGGIGTTIFTIGGCLIMIVAAGLFFATRRKAEK